MQYLEALDLVITRLRQICETSSDDSLRAEAPYELNLLICMRTTGPHPGQSVCVELFAPAAVADSPAISSGRLELRSFSEDI